MADGIALGTLLGTLLGSRLGTDLCPTAGHAITSPSSILASLYHTDFRADDPFRVMGAGAAVAGLYNYGLDLSDALQGTAGLRPLYGATSFGGRGPGITFDGTDDNLKATCNGLIAAGKRPYVWYVGTLNANTVGFLYGIGKPGNTNSGIANVSLVLDAQFEGTNNINGTADLSAHLLEMSWDGTNKLLVDGAVVTAGNAGVLATDVTVMTLGARFDGGQPSSSTMARFIVAADTPSAQQKTDMRAYLRGANHANYTSSSYGLP